MVLIYKVEIEFLRDIAERIGMGRRLDPFQKEIVQRVMLTLYQMKAVYPQLNYEDISTVTLVSEQPFTVNTSANTDDGAIPSFFTPPLEEIPDASKMLVTFLNDIETAYNEIANKDIKLVGGSRGLSEGDIKLA